MGPLLDGLLCRLLLYTNLAFSRPNQAIIEFSTPRHVAPTSMLICLTDPSYELPNLGFYISALIEGGDIFSTAGSRDVISGYFAPGFGFSSFSRFDTPDLAAGYYGTVYEALSTDPYYATSYSNQRYDDLQTDARGNLIRGVADFSLTTKTTSGNCVLFTGRWQRNTRYQATLNFANPPPASADHRERPSPGIWIAPLTYSTYFPANETYPTSGILTVRGDKYGAACPLRSKIAATSSRLYSACFYATGLNPPSTNPAVCQSYLRNISTLPGNVGNFPFTAPGVANVSLNTSADTSCSGNAALSPRLGGECIDCGTGSVAGFTCACPANVVKNLVGSVACGEYISSSGRATDVLPLAVELCQQYSQQQELWKERLLPDAIVSRLYLTAFTQQASLFLDSATVRDANQTFYQKYVQDERRPTSPTRKYGVAPNCNRCKDGLFEDVFNNNEETPIDDSHFNSMNTFRLIGYILHTVAGSTCSALWDPADPLEWKYGFYEDILCQPLPANLSSFYPEL